MGFKKGGEGATCEKLNHLSKEREDLQDIKHFLRKKLLHTNPKSEQIKGV